MGSDKGQSMQLPPLALRFEPEAFQFSPTRVMGRQSAGHGFLKALVQASAPMPLTGFGPHSASSGPWRQMVQSLDAQRQVRWLQSDQQKELAAIGLAHMPDPMLGDQARLRQTVGAAAYSITGITHTIASQSVMRALADYYVAPLMPWDGLICTSRAVKAAVMAHLEHQGEYIRQRFGVAPPALPQMPIIALGVDSQNFEIKADERQAQRAQLGIAEDAVIFLYVGRLSVHAKANPYQAYRCLERVARKIDKPVVFVQCGWFANPAIEKQFKESAAKLAPNLHCYFLDGRQPQQLRQAWALGDIFLSLSDNLQETFGLTIIEAMAAGLPVLASDWDGYRDMVRHGTDGFLLPTHMPEAPSGFIYAQAYESGTINYDQYCALTSQLISLDADALYEKALCLAQDPALRQSMGQAGKSRAHSDYDWRVVLGHYAEFWQDLTARRLHAQAQASAFVAPSAMLDPFAIYAGYPSHILQPNMRVTRRDDLADYPADFSMLFPALPLDKALAALLPKIDAHVAQRGSIAIQDLALDLRIEAPTAMRAVALLLKAELLLITP